MNFCFLVHTANGNSKGSASKETSDTKLRPEKASCDSSTSRKDISSQAKSQTGSSNQQNPSQEIVPIIPSDVKQDWLSRVTYYKHHVPYSNSTSKFTYTVVTTEEITDFEITYFS